MKQVWTITMKELRSYFNSPMAYIFIDVFLVLTAFLFFQNYFVIAQADMRGYFSLVPWVFLLLVPAITMRLWAEEKKLGTVEILLTLPITDTQIVLGKYLASLLFLMITLALSFLVPVVVVWSGPADIGVIVASYIGSVLIGGSFVALGIWLSAFTDNQIIAFILAVTASFLFLIIGQVFILQTLPGFMAPLFQFLGLNTHFNAISRGVLDSRDLIFYVSFIGLFLFLNVQQIAGRRFN